MIKTNSTFPTSKTVASILLMSLMLSLLPMNSARAQVSGSADTSAVRIPAAFRFNANLKYGQTISPDVTYLQRFLNMAPSTRIAETGAGSNSQLTSYFGLKTKSAVMRFQSLYGNEVLAPAGLSAPTGFVGEFTRRKMNSLLALSPDSTSPSAYQTAGSPNIPQAPQQPAQTTYQALQQSQASTPQWWQQQQAVAQQAGAAPLTDYTPQVMRFDEQQAAAGALRPELTGMSPAVVTSGEQIITITGRNFDAHPILFGNLGTAAATSTNNGQTITFALKDFSDYQRAKIYYSSTTQDFFVQVVNAGLASEMAGVITYSFPKYTGPASSTVPAATTTSNTSASQSGDVTNGLMAVGAIVGVGLMASAVSSYTAGAASAAAAASVNPVSMLIRPFGGMVLVLYPCMDSPNIVIFVLNAGVVPTPIRLLYIPVVSRLYMNFVFRPGGYVLGNYMLGGWCSAAGGVIEGTITQMGTSL